MPREAIAACRICAGNCSLRLTLDDDGRVVAARSGAGSHRGRGRRRLTSPGITGCAACEHPQRTARTIPCPRWNVPVRRTEWFARGRYTPMYTPPPQGRTCCQDCMSDSSAL